jgi:DMSO/TMAO reductase YedYZ molybdopterin-dependent catalytic subunit
MGKSSLWIGAFLSALLSLAFTSLTYAGEQLARLPSVTFDLFEWLTRVLPGAFINAAIAAMVRVITVLRLGPTASTAKMAETGIAVIEFIVLGFIFGLLVTALARSDPSRAGWIGLSGGAVLFFLFAIIEGMLNFPGTGSVVLGLAWIAALCLVWGGSIGAWASLSSRPAAADQAPLDPSRRRFIFWLGGSSLFVALGGLGLVRLARSASQAVAQPTPTTPNQPALEFADLVAQTNGPAASPSVATLEARFPPVPGTRREITFTETFYRVDINITPPEVDANTYQLSIDGLVDKPLKLSMDQIRAYPPISQVITLECISNEVGGDLISTAIFKGAPLKDVLADAGVKPSAQWINMVAADGYTESMPIQEAMDERTLLVYEMNGNVLPVTHGFPLRIYIPNHYGMKQPKWLLGMTLSESEDRGFWEQRGWSDLAVVKTTSVIDNVAMGERNPITNTIPVGGIAFAGARGISRVEIQIDDGAWMPAKLRAPALSPLSWVQWRFDLPPVPGSHQLRVRATDGTGAVQSESDAGPFPDGATGLYFYRVTI